MENSKSKESAEEKETCLTWKKRTLLERYLAALCLLFFIGFLVMIGLLLHLDNMRKTSKKEVCLNNVCKHQAGSILTNMDFTVDPCKNFYQFSCGNQIKYKSIYGEEMRSFYILQDYILYLEKEELQKPQNADDPPFINKVKKYYESCLNKSTDLNDVVREMLHTLHLDTWPLTRDDNWKNSIEEVAALGIVYTNFGLLFNIYGDANQSYIDIHRGYTSIRSSVLLNKTEEKYIKARKQYVNLIDYLFNKLNLSPHDSVKYRDEILEFETSLAQIQEVDRDDNSTNSTIRELQSTCRQINWKRLFKFFFMHLDHGEEYSDEYLLKIFSMDYINDICRLVEKTKPNVVYNTILWNMFIPYLARFDSIFKQLLINLRNYVGHFDLKLETLKWKNCLNEMELYVQLGVDYLMINSLQSDEGLKEVKGYSNEIRHSLDEIFSEQDWMDNYSKNITRFELKSIVSLIGYLNGSVDKEFFNLLFDNLNITKNYINNIFHLKKQMSLNEIFNSSIISFFREKIIMKPLQVGASFGSDPRGNFLEIPLGIFHPPFYAYKGPQYLNYGGIAFVISHEFSHGFDIMDFKRDKTGNSTEEDELNSINFSEEFLEEYKKRKICLMNQYSQFPLEGDLMINGNSTIRDNFSDNSGLTIAYRAYEKYLKRHGDEPQLPGLDFTNRQMFFIGYSQIWCEVIESMKKTFEDDMHSPGKYRVLVPLMNSPEFSKVFKCPLNSDMNPERKCRVWG